jgi:hypothetical protein
VFFLGSLQARFDQINLSFWRFDPGLRFLLKRMEHIYAASQPHGLDGAICITAMVLDDFQNARTAESSKRLRVDVLSTLLGHV